MLTGCLYVVSIFLLLSSFWIIPTFVRDAPVNRGNNIQADEGKVADQFLQEGGVIPDGRGDCPKGINVRDFVREKEHKVFERFASFFHGAFSRFSFNTKS